MNHNSNNQEQTYFPAAEGLLDYALCCSATSAFSWLEAPTNAFTFKTLCQTGVEPTVSKLEIADAKIIRDGLINIDS